MTTADERSAYLRTLDTEGRTFGAPAWDGPLSELDANELWHRAHALGGHIGALTTRYSTWTSTYDVRVNVDDLLPWATARAACLNALEQRALDAGCRPLDLVFDSPSWKAGQS